MSNNFALFLQGLRALSLSAIAAVALAVPNPASAAPHGGGGYGGGYHGGSVGGYRGGGYAPRAGYAGRGYGGYGYRGYYGRGYYGGYRGYGYGGWGYGGWWGWPTGLVLASLPLYYSTWYWNGVPYYYANDSYYLWDAPGNRYEQVAPPSGLLSNGAPAPAGSTRDGSTAELFAYPKNGQSAEQQSRDRQECRDWATAQQGGPGAAGAIAAATPQNSDANARAQTACLEGRGYSVR